MNGAGRPRSPIARLAAMTLGELVIAALLGGAALLLVELRFEHREVLGETWRAWLPLGYLALLVVVGAVALARFHRGGRRVLVALFALALVLGAVGVWFHADGHPVRALGRIAAAWLAPPGSDAGVRVGSEPPVLAPAAFLGVGLVGLLSCLRR
ncbi:MAG TPA: hypothetical protein VKE22_23260 [Haliangiales bacterium]|nr:hypothetical protein [Haliangiales bacterium]